MWSQMACATMFIATQGLHVPHVLFWWTSTVLLATTTTAAAATSKDQAWGKRNRETSKTSTLLLLNFPNLGGKTYQPGINPLFRDFEHPFTDISTLVREQKIEHYNWPFFTPSLGLPKHFSQTTTDPSGSGRADLQRWRRWAKTGGSCGGSCESSVTRRLFGWRWRRVQRFFFFWGGNRLSA